MVTDNVYQIQEDNLPDMKLEFSVLNFSFYLIFELCHLSLSIASSLLLA